MIGILYMHSMRYLCKMTSKIGLNFKRAILKVVLILNKFIYTIMTYQSPETSSLLPRDRHSPKTRAFSKDLIIGMNVEYVHANQNSKTDFANRGNKLPTNSKNICKTIIQPLLLDKVIAYLFVT